MTVSQAGMFSIQEFADAGTPLVLGRLYTYAYGTTTQKIAYTDAAGLVPHTYTLDAAEVPYIALNSRGELPAPLYLLTDGSYDLALKRADGSSVWTRRADGAASAATVALYATSGGSALIGFLQAGTGAVARTGQDKMRETVSVKDFGAKADGVTSDSAAINAAIASGAKNILMPWGVYISDATIRLKDGVRLIGDSSIQGSGTSIHFTKNDGTHCFDSDPALFLSGVSVQNMEIVNTANTAGTVGTGDAFHLFALTNNCNFKNVLVRNFGGDGWSIGKQTTTLTDKTALQNVHFEQCFVVSCGGYAFDVVGFVNATWLMCDLNSCATGYWRFNDGVTNQTQINIYGCWIEGTQTWTALTAIEMVDTKGQMLNLIGCEFTNGHSGTRVVKSTTSSCRLNAVGVTGFGWANGLHEDTPAGYNTPLNAPTNRFQSVITPQMQVQGTGPIWELFEQVTGTVDQRRFRYSLSGTDLLLNARDDAGGSVRNLWKTNFVTGAHVPAVDNSYDFGSTALRIANSYVTKVHLSGSATIFDSAGTGTPEGVVTAGVGSTFRRTDGGASTSFYVKETGTGNTGWIAK